MVYTVQRFRIHGYLLFNFKNNKKIAKLRSLGSFFIYWCDALDIHRKQRRKPMPLGVGGMRHFCPPFLID
ncbi:hypothetical protein DNHGIG_40860 [Collibacillus ludicampi]|uniref:Uncharacterized protein n=1 Tax=Collibacillus ludicampi TaxID=2771369 RepID=A0AAV4LNS8_9BACL|nr:hypothetical protein DNHGIG_40860 [Collibacillus ludicampi]